MNEQAQITGAGPAVRRRALDFYPTPPDVTTALLDFLQLPQWFTVREPAAGDGAMSRVLEKRFYRVISEELAPDGYGFGNVDFLGVNTVAHANAIITNPPFGLAEQFILTALQRADVVAMLLKSQYWHAASRAYLFETHPPAWILPLTWRPDFLAGERGGAPTMEMQWSVWIKGQTDTRTRLLRRPTKGT